MFDAATVRRSEDGGRRSKPKQIMINDVRRAYFYAPCRRTIYIELPNEDPQAGQGLVGKLNLSLYGTRDAAASWQEKLSEHMTEIGFRKGSRPPKRLLSRAEEDQDLGARG